MKKVWPILLFALIPLLLYAEDGEMSRTDRRLLLFYSDETDSIGNVRSLLYESLVSELASGENSPAVTIYPRSWTGLTEDGLDHEAQATHSDAWLTVRVLPMDENLYRVEFTLKDLLSSENFSSYFTYPIPTFRDVKDIFWYEVTTAVKTRLLPREEKTALSIIALPGTVISGIPGKKKVKVGASGRLEYPDAGGGMLELRAEKSGYYPEGVYVVPGDGITEVRFDQHRGPRGFFGLYAWNGQFPGVEGGIYTLPGEVFIKGGFTSYIVGLYLPGGSDVDASLLTSLNLVQLHLSVGTYISDMDARVRWYGGMGIQGRLIVSSDYFGFDPIVPLCIQPVLGAELSHLGSARLFIEYAPSLYIWDSAQKLAGTYPEDYSMPYITGDNFFVEPLAFRVGLRWQFGGKSR